jgi:uncharacterized membrane protein
VVELTRGQRAADAVARFMGSWKFVIAQASLMAAWFALNAVAWSFSWDPYPFILMNLAMSAEAAFATPLLLMSQNRSAEADREVLHADYIADLETKRLLDKIADHLGVNTDD